MADPKAAVKSQEKKVNGAARVVGGEARKFFEEVNARHRLVVKADTTAEELANPEYLRAIAGKLADWDLIDVISDDGSWYAQCLVIEGGIGIGGGRARMVLLPSYPMKLAAIDRTINDGLPAGYSMTYNRFSRKHIPMFGDVPLNSDGLDSYEGARALIVHHAQKTASA